MVVRVRFEVTTFGLCVPQFMRGPAKKRQPGFSGSSAVRKAKGRMEHPAFHKQIPQMVAGGRNVLQIPPILFSFQIHRLAA